EKAAGNLVIVTELADSNLRQQFERFREETGTGIPALELLNLLEPAAQALDALHSQTSLPHLDVKPENILLVAERAKVGDFWLGPSVCEPPQLRAGGLGPLYSAPKMFEGTPGQQSDKYSLAIVYVEMLTGQFPFQAGKPAWIALQHLHGVPDLSNLPEKQRPVVARALSKDPTQRHESCLALIARLKTSLVDDSAANAGSPPPQAPPLEPGKPVEPPAVTAANHHGEPIPGYATTEILGQGEFGEVWKAVAPDGRPRAVKIVYEDESEPTWVDDALKVVSKLKEVNHPGL